MKNLTITYIVVFFVFLTETVNAQIVISKPNLGFSQACASPSFNTYMVSFSFSIEGVLDPTNQFIIELSDGTGSFASPTTIYTSTAGSVTISPATLTFSLPTTTAGEAYKLRVKSTTPAATSSVSNAFAAYYKIQDSPFSINNLISTGSYCPDGSYLLTIDNPGDQMNDSPLLYPSLTFEWRKETSPTTSVFMAKGPSLSVNEPGTYFVKTDYGTCTSNSFSNRVTVSQASSGLTITNINSSKGTSFCSGEGATMLSVISGNSYQWFKDGIQISGATSQEYETDSSGEFSVTIDMGGCMASASIILESNGFTSTIDVPEMITMDKGKSIVATVTTNADNPEFKWYLNDTIISGKVTSSYEATQIGSYRVVVSQTTGCIATSEFLFVINEAFPEVENIPNLISPNGDGINDTWIIPQEYVSGTNTEVLIISAQGKVELKTSNYLNNWPENQLDFNAVNPVYYYIITTQNNKIRKGAITVVK